MRYLIVMLALVAGAAHAEDYTAAIETAQQGCLNEKATLKGKGVSRPACERVKELKKMQKTDNKAQRQIQHAQIKAQKRALKAEKKTQTATQYPPGSKRIWNPVVQKYCISDSYGRMLHCGN